MITSQHIFTDGFLTIQHTKIEDVEEGVPAAFRAWRCLIGERRARQGNAIVSEPVWYAFEAKDVKDAFGIARANVKKWAGDVSAEANRPKLVTAGPLIKC